MRFVEKVFFLGVASFLPLVVAAQVTTQNNPPVTTQNRPPVTTTNSLIGIGNPLNANTICDALKIFLNALLTLGVPVMVLFLVYAGFRLVWARGNSKQLQSAKANLWYTILGIGIFMGAWLLGQIIANTLNQLGTAAGSSNPTIGQCR
jgi:hypothetical protein